MNTTSVEDIDRLEVTGRARAALADLMRIDRYQWDERGTLTLHGRLLGPADTLYRQIRAQMEPLGFTPFLQRRADEDELMAVPVVISATSLSLRLTILLGVVTIGAATLLAFLHYPLPWFPDSELRMPFIYVAGMWMAVVSSLAA